MRHDTIDASRSHPWLKSFFQKVLMKDSFFRWDPAHSLVTLMGEDKRIHISDDSELKEH